MQTLLIVDLNKMSAREIVQAYMDQRSSIMTLLLFELYVITNGNNPPPDCDLLYWFLDQHERRDGKWIYRLL